MILLKFPGRLGIESYRISHFPCRIGRGLDCDIVINDERVSNSHALILEDAAGYRMVDSGSTNGLFLDGQRLKEIALMGTLVVSLGGLEMEIRSSHEELEKTVIVHREELARWPQPEFRPWIFVLALFLGSCLISFVAAYWMEVGFKLNTYFQERIVDFFVLLSLSSLLGLWSKIQTKKYQIGSFFVVLVLAVLVIQIVGLFKNIILFNINLRSLEAVGFWCLTLGVAFWIFDQIGKLIFTSMRLGIRRCVVLGLMAVGALLSFGVTGFNLGHRNRALEIEPIIGLPLRKFDLQAANFDHFNRQVLELDADLIQQRQEILEKRNRQTK